MNAIKIGIKVILALIVIDIFVLFMSLGQIAFEAQTGYWSPFWKWQAEQIIQFLK